MKNWKINFDETLAKTIRNGTDFKLRERSVARAKTFIEQVDADAYERGVKEEMDNCLDEKLDIVPEVRREAYERGKQDWEEREKSFIDSKVMNQAYEKAAKVAEELYPDIPLAEAIRNLKK